MNSSESAILFRNGRLITPGGIVDGKSLLYDEGMVLQIANNISTVGRDVVDLKGGYLCPGLMELHIHGCGEWGFENIDREGFTAAADFLLSRGITAAVPTLQWDSKTVANLAEIIEAYRKEKGRLKVHGIYLEGPFINPDKKGGIDEKTIALPDPKLLREVLAAGRGLIRIMTVAPELPGIDEMASLMGENRIIPSFGHSNCRLGEAEALFDHCTARGIHPGITHLFNASSPLSHKEPGLAMLPFTRNIHFELNGDGVHVGEPMLKLMSRSDLGERMLLISDALISAGLPLEAGKDFFYYDRKVSPTKRGVRLAEGDILAGSACLIPEIIRNYTEITEAQLSEAVNAATCLPRKFLGLPEGNITPGSICRPVIFDNNFTPIKTHSI